MQTLQEFLEPWRARPFDWGTRNCCHLVAAWVREREGVSPLVGIGPMPHTQTGVLRKIVRLGGLRAAWTRQLRRDPIGPTVARLGDVVLLAVNGDGEFTGICNGRTALLMTSAGIMALPMDDAVCAWPVGVRKW